MISMRTSKWLNVYAQVVLRAKEDAGTDPSVERAVRRAIAKTFSRVYRVVAFDIDGTITEPGSETVLPGMVEVIGDLLRRGVPVVLTTGRGRSSARDAAGQIRESVRLSPWYLRQLLCVTHNGVFLLRTPPESPEAILRNEELLVPPPRNLEKLSGILRDEFAKNGIAYRDVSREPHSIRITFEGEHARDVGFRKLREVRTGWAPEFRKLQMTVGCFGAFASLDLGPTNKAKALKAVAAKLGEKVERILRIGDQGQEHGNDYDLLHSTSGFSVDRVSRVPDRCFPIVDVDHATTLRGAEAAAHLVRQALLLPPLSLPPARVEDALPALRRFERLALERSATERHFMTERLRLRLRYLLPDSAGQSAAAAVQIDDLFDGLSGGVILKEWEALDDRIPTVALELFELNVLMKRHKQAPSTRLSMFTDTAVLLRGPQYYLALCQAAEPRERQTYQKWFCDFLQGGESSVRELAMAAPTIVNFKFALAIQDNVRCGLGVLWAALVESGDAVLESAQFFGEAMLPHTQEMLRFTFDMNMRWQEALDSYAEFLVRLGNFVRSGVLDAIPSDVQLGRWNEADHFVQNVAAVELGLHELLHATGLSRGERTKIVGIANGGNEIAAIAAALASTLGLAVIPQLARVSIYGREDLAKMLRSGEYEKVVRELARRKEAILELSGDGGAQGPARAILLDDNLTTGVTLQLVRDLLVLREDTPVGAIAVRFAGTNRREHWNLEGLGVPDPQVLFSFVRGLVAPSPYARLLFSGEGARNRYVDATDIFHKGRRRIERYLLKNGIQVRQS